MNLIENHSLLILIQKGDRIILGKTPDVKALQ